jgi:hypothetical protein
MTALVEPPIAALTRTAFSNAARVMITDGVNAEPASSTARAPVASASTVRRASTAGRPEPPGSIMPSVSARQAIVEAVPMVMQCPDERFRQDSNSSNSSRDTRPARRSSVIRQMSVPDPTSRPRNLPFSIGPPVSRMAGTSALAAPISAAGVVLSQPASSTTESSGLARICSSISIAARLRYSMEVGRRNGSPSDIAGNSSGSPPACSTPRLTASARIRRCALQGVSSE